MQLKPAFLRLFHQLEEMLRQLSAAEYGMPVDRLSGATIGQHCRHLIEHFEELETGYHTGIVDYSRRQRHHLLETEPQYAFRRLADIKSMLDHPDKLLVLHTPVDDSLELSLPSSYYRELVHNLDHTVHHMAMIRVGLTAFAHIQLPGSFGVAWSTLRHRAATTKFINN